ETTDSTSLDDTSCRAIVSQMRRSFLSSRLMRPRFFVTADIPTLCMVLLCTWRGIRFWSSVAIDLLNARARMETDVGYCLVSSTRVVVLPLPAQAWISRWSGVCAASKIADWRGEGTNMVCDPWGNFPGGVPLKLRVGVPLSTGLFIRALHPEQNPS